MRALARDTLHLLALTISLTFSASTLAEFKDFGDYEVHYSVFPSTFLTPEVAAQNNLTRSKAIGILNISIMETTELGGLKTVTGQVEGRVLNDIQQPRFLAFRRIQEGDAVYFISEFQYRSGELLTFHVTARPTGHAEDLPIRFAHTLYNED